MQNLCLYAIKASHQRRKTNVNICEKLIIENVKIINCTAKFSSQQNSRSEHDDMDDMDDDAADEDVHVC